VLSQYARIPTNSMEVLGQNKGWSLSSISRIQLRGNKLTRVKEIEYDVGRWVRRKLLK
jgi:hypothetical protein